MDDATEQALARFQQRMANANRLYDQADTHRARADEIERQLDLPDHERPLGDEATLRLEATLLREQADALTQDANGIQERLHNPPSQNLAKEFEDWAARLERGEDLERTHKPPDRGW